MDSESKYSLQEILELTQENNKMLHSMKRSMRFARIMSYIYWAFIIGSAVGAYYLIQPYVDQAVSVYEGASEKIDGINNSIKSFINFGQ